MKQKVSRGQLIKIENASFENTPAQRGDVLWQKAPSENISFKRKERLTRESHPSGLKFQTGGGTDRVSARELRWSPAAIHSELGGSEGTYMLSVFFRVAGWWWWSSASTTSTAVLAPADGSSGGVGSRRGGLRRSN